MTIQYNTIQYNKKHLYSTQWSTVELNLRSVETDGKEWKGSLRKIWCDTDCVKKVMKSIPV